MPTFQLAVNGMFLAVGMGIKYLFFKKRGFEKDYVAGIKEGFQTYKKCQKVPYRPEHRMNYWAVEWELISGTALYIYEFTKRQLKKLR